MIPDPEKLSAYSVLSFKALRKAAAAEIAKAKPKPKKTRRKKGQVKQTVASA
jgi:hypothetical protein